MLVSNDQSSHQIGVGNGGLYTNADQLNLVEVVIDDLSNNVVRVDVEQMLSIGEYVYIIAKPVGSPAVSVFSKYKTKNGKSPDISLFFQSTPRELLVSNAGSPFKATSFAGGNLRVRFVLVLFSFFFFLFLFNNPLASFFLLSSFFFWNKKKRDSPFWTFLRAL